MTSLNSDGAVAWLTQIDPGAADHPAWPSFLVAMHKRAYGREALSNAWYWYRDGWDRRAHGTDL